MKRTFFVLAMLLTAALLLTACAGNSGSPPPSIQTSMIGQHRSTEHQARNTDRHPAQTLAFFAVEPTMSVVEIWPGDKAWYTEILAPYLKGTGTLYAAHFSENASTPYFVNSLQKFKQKMAATPAIYSEIKSREEMISSMRNFQFLGDTYRFLHYPLLQLFFQCAFCHQIDSTPCKIFQIFFQIEEPEKRNP